MATQSKKQAVARLNYLRIAPRKVRAVAQSLKGLSVSEAQAQLLFQKRRPAKPLLKLLRSAIANAKNTKQLNEDKLGIVNIKVDQGPRFKRYMPRARGVASLIEKKSSHITLTLEESDKFSPRFKILRAEIKKSKVKTAKKEKEAKPPALGRETPSAGKKQPGFFRKFFRRKAI